MRLCLSISTLAAAVGLSGSAAAQKVSATGSTSVQIVQPAGIVVVQDILAKMNASMLVIGLAGDAVSMAVPGTVDVISASGQNLTLGTASQLSTNSLVLSQDSVSVSIGALVNGQAAAAPPGSYGGIMVVLAQYN